MLRIPDNVSLAVIRADEDLDHAGRKSVQEILRDSSIRRRKIDLGTYFADRADKDGRGLRGSERFDNSSLVCSPGDHEMKYIVSQEILLRARFPKPGV